MSSAKRSTGPLRCSSYAPTAISSSDAGKKLSDKASVAPTIQCAATLAQAAVASNAGQRACARCASSAMPVALANHTDATDPRLACQQNRRQREQAVHGGQARRVAQRAFVATGRCAHWNGGACSATSVSRCAAATSIGLTT